MPLPKEQTHTSEDYWNLPEGHRAELISGQFYDMAPPSFKHQKIISQLSYQFNDYIKRNKGNCEVIPAPFAVNLDADDRDWVEPDISVICDKNKLTDRGCSGAPDLIVEVVSPSSRRMDYIVKNTIYSEAGVREYWIVDPENERTTVYHYEADDAPTIYTFSQAIPMGIFEGLSITMADLLK